VSPAGEGEAGTPPARLPWRSAGILVALALGAWGAFHWLHARPETAERLLGAGAHPEGVRLLGRLAGAVPVPVAEFAAVALALWVLALPVRMVLEARGASRAAPEGALADGARGRSLARPLARATLRLVRMVALLFVSFQLLWGFQYARPGLDTRLGIPASGAVPDEELHALGEALVARTNALYRELHATDDFGTPTLTAGRAELRGPFRTDADEAWSRAQARWALPPAMARSRPGPKPLLLTPVLRWLGVTGIYVPWTAEAVVMDDIPGAALPHTALHETAHQRGVAREADANALAYLVSLHMEDPAARYSGALFLQRQTLAALGRRDPEGTLALLEARLPGVQRDVNAIVERSRAVQGPVRQVADRANDAMLRRHGITEGVASYGGSLWIVVALIREEGVEAVLPPTAHAP
jgi:hypothetical protein